MQSHFQILLRGVLGIVRGYSIFVFCNFYCNFMIQFFKSFEGVQKVAPPPPSPHSEHLWCLCTEIWVKYRQQLLHLLQWDLFVKKGFFVFFSSNRVMLLKRTLLWKLTPERTYSLGKKSRKKSRKWKKKDFVFIFLLFWDNNQYNSLFKVDLNYTLWLQSSDSMQILIC